MPAKRLLAVVCLLLPATCFADCPWLSVSRIDKTFPDGAPWSTLDVRQGRCKFEGGNGVIAVNQIVQSSAKEAQDYVKSLGEGMAEDGAYRVKSEPTLGKAGIAVWPGKESDNSSVMLAGHQKNIVVMTTVTIPGGSVDAATQSAARELTKSVFAADTGGGIILPKVKPLTPEEAKREKREEAEARSVRHAEEDRVKANVAAWEDVGGGVLRDKQTGLRWTQSDNGKDIEQADAIKYCAHLNLQGGGWRLPNVDELNALYISPDLDGPGCGTAGQRCHTTEQFHLSSYWFWSATPDSDGKSWHVDLSGGPHARELWVANFSKYHRALCVRDP